jgi:hypothetical protein
MRIAQHLRSANALVMIVEAGQLQCSNTSRLEAPYAAKGSGIEPSGQGRTLPELTSPCRCATLVPPTEYVYAAAVRPSVLRPALGHLTERQPCGAIPCPMLHKLGPTPSEAED